jgi:DNA-binding NarL/FixJ family response regulator
MPSPHRRVVGADRHESDENRDRREEGQSVVTHTDINARVRTQGPIRLFLVDDHELIRRGLGACIEAEEDLELAGEAASAKEALARIPAVLPDLVVLDVRLPDGNGVEVCREIRSHHPDVKVLMLTSFSDETALLDSIVAGASGYVLKATPGRELIGTLRRVAAGQSLIDPAMTASLFQRLRKDRSGDDPSARLTGQERRVLDLIAQGCTNREIAEQLHLAERTVKNYVSSMLGKLGMRHRTQAALYASKLARSD